MTLIFAVDGGGTSCKAAIISPNGTVLADAKTGPANIHSNPKLAAKSITNAAQSALKAAGHSDYPLSELSAYLGLAGANVYDAPSHFANELPFERTFIEDDTTIALQGALADGDGIVAILGTGSVFMSRKEAVIQRVGGWGFRLSDHGSGARLGQALFEYVLHAHDQVLPGSEMVEKILDEFGGPQKLVAFAQDALPEAYARYAPIVFQHANNNDAAALKLIAQTVKHIEAALAMLLWEDCPKLCLIGGLGQLYAPYLSQAYQDRLQPPLGQALDGAVSLAWRKFGA